MIHQPRKCLAYGRPMQWMCEAESLPWSMQKPDRQAGKKGGAVDKVQWDKVTNWHTSHTLEHRNIDVLTIIYIK